MTVPGSMSGWPFGHRTAHYLVHKYAWRGKVTKYYITITVLRKSITSGVLQETELINTIHLQPSAMTYKHYSVHHITPSPL